MPLRDSSNICGIQCHYEGHNSVSYSLLNIYQPSELFTLRILVFSEIQNQKGGQIAVVITECPLITLIIHYFVFVVTKQHFESISCFSDRK